MSFCQVSKRHKILLVVEVRRGEHDEETKGELLEVANPQQSLQQPQQRWFECKFVQSPGLTECAVKARRRCNLKRHKSTMHPELRESAVGQMQAQMKVAWRDGDPSGFPTWQAFSETYMFKLPPIGKRTPDGYKRTPGRYDCAKCGKHTKMRRNAQMHLEDQHCWLSGKKCVFCRERFGSQEEVFIHTFFCDKQDYEFQTEWSLARGE